MSHHHYTPTLSDMPWHIEEGRDGCPFAVVPDAGGEPVGCHETEADARDHMSALYANVPDAKKVDGGGGMLALRIHPQQAVDLSAMASLPITSMLTIPPDDLHITLMYFDPVSTAEIRADPNNVQRLVNLANEIAMTYTFNDTLVGGYGRFASNEDFDPYVALVDSPSIHAAHHHVMTRLREDSKVKAFLSVLKFWSQPEPEHGYTPHITLAYLAKNQPVIVPARYPEPLMITSVVLKLGNEVVVDLPIAVQPTRPLDVAAMTAEAASDTDVVPVPNTHNAEPVDGMNTVESTETFCSHPDCGKAAPVFFAMCNDHAPEGAPALSVEKAGRRMAAGMLSRLAEALATIKEIQSWAAYEDAKDEDEDEAKMVEKKPSDYSPVFRVFKADDGTLRWASLSSNGFMDRTGEIVSTDALRKIVAKGDETGERGTLRIFHVPGSDIGDCDFQAMEGRFLVEAGSFYDTDLARKAISYFTSTDDVLGTSIGFTYPVDTFKDNVYLEIENIVERSVCPLADAANPFTSFALGEPIMDDRARAMLSKIVGPDAADEMITTASKSTAVLEGLVSYKASVDEAKAKADEEDKGDEDKDDEKADPYVARLRKMLDGIEDEDKRKAMMSAFSKAFGSSAKTDPEPKPDPDPDPGDDGDDGDGGDDASEIKALMSAIQPMLASQVESQAKTLETLSAMGEQINSVASRLAAVEEAQKSAADAPRAAALFRGTSDKDNIIDATKAREITGDPADPAVSPVSGFIADLAAMYRGGGE